MKEGISKKLFYASNGIVVETITTDVCDTFKKLSAE